MEKSPHFVEMDDTWTCHQCGLPVSVKESSVEVRETRRGFSTPQLFHEDCFRCYACKRHLSKECYFLSTERNLYCVLHHDFEEPNGHDRFVKELASFRSRSLDSTVLLERGTTQGALKAQKYERVEKSTDNRHDSISRTCTCTNDKLAYNSDKFWIECLDANCPLSHYPVRGPSPICNQGIKTSGFLEHYDEEIYETCFYEHQHFNYYCNDDVIGPVLLSIRQEVLCNREYYRILIRSSSIINEGLVPSSCFFVSNKYDRDEVVGILARELKLSSNFTETINPSTPQQLCKLDKVLLKNNFKVGVLYVEEGQSSEEEFFQNSTHSQEFHDFLEFLGHKVTLKGFAKYSGGLDTTFGLTGTTSVFTEWKSNQIMFHVSTMLPFDSNDKQTLQRKRHIGNDIVCIVFLSGSNTQFQPDSITSNFIHIFIVIRPIFNHSHNQIYEITIVSRDHVQPFQPPLWSSTFSLLDSQFRDWLLSKIINGERASYRSPKFAAMQERSRKQLMSELIKDELSGSPIVEKREKHSPSPKMAFSNEALSLDWHSETFEDLKGLKKDFQEAFNLELDELHDICFIVGANEQQAIPGVKSILAARSKVFSSLIKGSAICKPHFQHHSIYTPVKPHGAAVGINQKKSPQRPKLRKRSSLDRLLRRRQTSQELEIYKENRLQPTFLDRQEILIPQFGVIELALLMEYLHTGSCVLYAEAVPAVLATAEYFEIDDLMKLCLDATEDLLTPQKACPMLVAVRAFTAKYRMADKLQRIIMEYIRSNITSVYNQFDLASLPEDCLILILSLDVKVDEMLKFHLVCRWIDRNTFSGSPGVAEVLKDALLSFIKLNNFTALDLRKHIGPSGLFDAKAVNDALRRKQTLDL